MHALVISHLEDGPLSETQSLVKPIIVPVFAGLLCSFVQAGNLTPSDRQALLEELQRILQVADSTVEARFRVAVAAYLQALESDDAAKDFYLKCVEKVDFLDQDRKPSEFREWKKQNEGKLNDPGFSTAVRVQLHWLVLTLQAASGNADREKLGLEARSTMAGIFRDPKRLSQHGDVLGQGAVGSVFARAYDISNVKVEEWPSSPFHIAEIYEKIVLPPLRQPAKIDELRNAWIERIQLEKVKIEEFGEDRRRKRQDAQQGDARQEQLDRFMAEEMPELVWEMEMDVYQYGDQSGAAVRMLEHIRKFITHRSAKKWSADLTKLLNPPVAVETAAE